MLQNELSLQEDKIKKLTLQAKSDLEYDASLAQIDVDAIIRYLQSQCADDRLPLLYLIDSICKNVPQYRQYFEKHVLGIIEMTFRFASRKTKLNK